MADQIVATTEQDQITAQVRAEYDAGIMYRHDREKAWQLIEDFCFNPSEKPLKDKFSMPVPVVPGCQNVPDSNGKARQSDVRAAERAALKFLAPSAD